jgi:hypothetical protein
MGTSYGGFLAAYLTHFREFDKLLLRTPAIYHPEDLYTLSHLIDRVETVQQYRPDAAAVEMHPLFTRASAFAGQVLVVIHDQDEDVPSATTDVYAHAFKAETYTAEGLRHGAKDPANLPEAVQLSYDYMGQWLSRNN